MQECRLSGIVETQEEELGVLVEQAERRQDIVDCLAQERACQHTVGSVGSAASVAAG